MAREGLFDDSGYKGFDYEPHCEECKYESEEHINGQIYFKCLARNGVCDFKEKQDEEILR